MLYGFYHQDRENSADKKNRRNSKLLGKIVFEYCCWEYVMTGSTICHHRKQ